MRSARTRSGQRCRERRRGSGGDGHGKMDDVRAERFVGMQGDPIHAAGHAILYCQSNRVGRLWFGGCARYSDVFDRNFLAPTAH